MDVKLDNGTMVYNATAKDIKELSSLGLLGGLGNASNGLTVNTEVSCPGNLDLLLKTQSVMNAQTHECILEKHSKPGVINLAKDEPTQFRRWRGECECLSGCSFEPPSSFSSDKGKILSYYQPSSSGNIDREILCGSSDGAIVEETWAKTPLWPIGGYGGW